MVISPFFLHLNYGRLLKMENIFSEKYFITTDSMFTSAQKPQKTCQDYSLCGSDPFPFLIISDGCGSSDNTDVGSRIISHVTKSLLFNSCLYSKEYSRLSELIIRRSYESIINMDIQPHCLDATLILAYIQEKICYVIMYGDGHIITTNKNGDLRTHEKVSFEGNAPYYLSYKLDSSRDEIYKEFAKDKHMKKIISNGILQPPESFNFSCFGIPLEDTKSIIITSDGIESFFNLRDGGKIPDDEIIKEIISFKNTKGEFIKRRIKRLLEDFSKQEIYNNDDISVAGFMIEENK